MKVRGPSRVSVACALKGAARRERSRREMNDHRRGALSKRRGTEFGLCPEKRGALRETAAPFAFSEIGAACRRGGGRESAVRIVPPRGARRLPRKRRGKKKAAPLGDRRLPRKKQRKEKGSAARRSAPTTEKATERKRQRRWEIGAYHGKSNGKEKAAPLGDRRLPGKSNGKKKAAPLGDRRLPLAKV